MTLSQSFARLIPPGPSWLTWPRLAWLNFALAILAVVYVVEVGMARSQAAALAHEAAQTLVWEAAHCPPHQVSQAKARAWASLRAARRQVTLVSLQLMLATLAAAILAWRWQGQRGPAPPKGWERKRDLGQLLLVGVLLCGYMAPAFSLPLLALAWILRLAEGMFLRLD